MGIVITTLKELPENCHDCPCCQYIELAPYDYCKADPDGRTINIHIVAKPNWCPLMDVNLGGKI